MPGMEDFGITALEAQAYGKPVILHHQSGVAEIIKDGVHGVHIRNESVQSLQESINSLEETEFDKNKLQKNVRKYETQRFTTEFKQLVSLEYQKHRSNHES